MTDDLIAFLRERLDEDERIARACDGHAAFDGTGIVSSATVRGPIVTVLPSDVATHMARHAPARALAEVDAKRRILDDLDYGGAEMADARSHVARRLAAIYRGHPDYRPEWAPDA
ncbi:DUF6221 family protein [Kitasatospora aureofaciens]|uniref:DUF6221 family protein n=1 Tax=Kitasatospora aureofaciens TaxID=1894 RepID=UPI0033F64B31